MFVPFAILIQKSIIISKVDSAGDIISKKGKIFMFKKVFKRVSAMLLAVLFMFSSTIFAGASFNPTYSGKFIALSDIYMTFSSSDAEMHRVIYSISGSTNAYLTISSPSSFSFSKDELYVYYNRKGTIETGSGSISEKNGPFLVQTNDIDVETNSNGKVTKVTIGYNGCY